MPDTNGMQTQVPKTDAKNEQENPDQAVYSSISQPNALDKQLGESCADIEFLPFNQSQTDVCDTPDLDQLYETFTSQHLSDNLYGQIDH